MCSINWTKSRGHILFYKILSKRSLWALKDEEPCLFYCKDTPNSLGGMRLLHDIIFYLILSVCMILSTIFELRV